MKNLLLTLCYDGTNYHGWQVQKNAVTVQETLQDALEKILQIRPNVIGCSRTDAGVHANMFCCNFHTDTEIPEEKLLLALNARLPLDIAVTAIREMQEDFHARYFCKKKQYLYQIWNDKIRNPFYENYALRLTTPLDCDYLNSGCKVFLGTHDFSGFCSTGSAVTDTVRTIYDMHFTRDGKLVTFCVEGNGFLYNMVRILVGTFQYVAEGKIQIEELSEILASRDRERAGKTVPAKGLYLNKVYY